MLRLTFCPATPSNSIIAILLGVLMVIVRFSPIAIRPVKPTSAAVYGEGGAKKSALLVAFPEGVATDIRPDVAFDGTFVAMLVEVAELSRDCMTLKLTRSLAIVVSKLVPVMVAAVPAAPIAGVNEVMVGATEDPAPTVKDALLVAVPVGLVTLIGP